MFIPTFGNTITGSKKVWDMKGVDCTSINQDTKGALTEANIEGFAYITAASLELAIEAAKELNKLHYTNKYSTPLRKMTVGNGSFEHDKVEILSVKILPLVVAGTGFDAENGRFTVLSSVNEKVGNVSMPVYEIKGPTGEIMKDVSQNYVMRYTGITIPENERKVAEVVVGPRSVSSRWTVSMTKDRKYLFCQSPSTGGQDPFKHIRCLDTFGVNCLQFVETAITRLVIGIMGQVAKEKWLDQEIAAVDKARSCANCKACRFLTGTDSVLGDDMNPDNPSRGTGALKNEGTMTNNYICAYSMQAPGRDRIEDLNTEQVIGFNSTGYSSAYLEHYRSEALDCKLYHPKDAQFVRNSANMIYTEGNKILITTAGLELIFIRGDENKYKKPAAPIMSDLKVIQGDILAAEEEIIIHQVNCKGVMGSGLALQIRQKFPKAYVDYLTAFKAGKLKPGEIVISKVADKSYIIHVCGQDDFGRDPAVVYTDYTALDSALNKVYEFSKKHKLRVAVPYGIGCGLAHGDWKTVQTIVSKNLPSARLYKK